ncbi:MAG: hypothetical protein WAM50_07850, partial [Pseudolabrys sp.]
LLNAAEDNGANDCNSGRCDARKNECSHGPTLFYFVISGVSNARAANRGAGGFAYTDSVFNVRQV